MAKTTRLSIRLEGDLAEELAEEVKRERRPQGAVVRDLLDEALKMRRCPGIAFLPGPTGRRAVIAGTGLEVSEVFEAYLEGGRSFEALQKAFDWLTIPQLRSALAYAEMYPEEIQARVRQSEQATEEAARHRYPYLFER